MFFLNMLEWGVVWIEEIIQHIRHILCWHVIFPSSAAIFPDPMQSDEVILRPLDHPYNTAAMNFRTLLDASLKLGEIGGTKRCGLAENMCSARCSSINVLSHMEFLLCCHWSICLSAGRCRES